MNSITLNRQFFPANITLSTELLRSMRAIRTMSTVFLGCLGLYQWMHLTETKKTSLVQAFDRSAGNGEIIAGAGWLVQVLRKRCRDCYELIDDLESLSDRVPVPYWLQACAKRSEVI